MIDDVAIEIARLLIEAEIEKLRDDTGQDTDPAPVTPSEPEQEPDNDTS